MSKRIFIVLFVLVIGISFLSANTYSDVNRLIKNGYVKSDPDAIRALVPQLSESEINSLYTWNKVDAVGGILMNAALGFGSGSFSQNDTVHGIIFLAGDTICTGMIVWTFLRNAGIAIGNEISGGDEVEDDYTLALAGLIGAVGLRIWQTIRAATYAKSYNSKLAYALKLDSAPTVAFLPYFKEGKTGLSVSARISY